MKLARVESDDHYRPAFKNFTALLNDPVSEEMDEDSNDHDPKRADSNKQKLTAIKISSVS